MHTHTHITMCACYSIFSRCYKLTRKTQTYPHIRTDAESVAHKTETQCAVKLLSKDVSSKSQSGERREDESTERTSGREEDVSLSPCVFLALSSIKICLGGVLLKMPHFAKFHVHKKNTALTFGKENCCKTHANVFWLHVSVFCLL